MQPIVGQVSPAGRLARTRNGRWIGCNPRNPVLLEEAINIVGKPRRMTRLTDESAGEARAPSGWACRLAHEPDTR